MNDDPVFTAGDVAGPSVAPAATVDPAPTRIAWEADHVSGRDLPAIARTRVAQAELVMGKGGVFMLQIVEVVFLDDCHDQMLHGGVIADQNYSTRRATC